MKVKPPGNLERFPENADHLVMLMAKNPDFQLWNSETNY
jgi:hypothetical protein